MGDPTTTAAAIALTVSLIFGLANHVQHIALDHMDVRSGTLVNIATTATILILLAPLYLEPGTLAVPAVGYFALSGLIVPALSISFATYSVRKLGPSLTAGLSATSPVFAMVFAVLMVGEVVTGRILVGTLIVMGGIMTVALRARLGRADWPVWALALPLGAALTRGISHPLVKLGLVALPSPLTAALVASLVSLGVLALLHGAAGRRLPPWNRGYAWFALCGVINGAGIVGLNLALEVGDVVIVAPLIATTPVFTLLTGYFVFRRERVGRSSVAATALIICGSFLIITR